MVGVLADLHYQLSLQPQFRVRVSVYKTIHQSVPKTAKLLRTIA